MTDISYKYGGFKKIGNFSSSWWLWLILFILFCLSIFLPFIVYCFLPNNYCPICNYNFFNHLKSKNPKGDKKTKNDELVLEKLNEFHSEIVDDYIEKIDEIFGYDEVSEYCDKLFTKHYENDGNLLDLEKLSNKFIKYLSSEYAIDKNDDKIIITLLNIVFTAYDMVDESHIYIAFLIVKFLWNKNVFFRKGNNYVLKGQAQTLSDDENIFENLDEFKETYWMYFYKSLKSKEHCYFLCAFVSEEYNDLILDYLYELKLPLSWNVSSLEEFIKIFELQREYINEDEDFIDYYEILEINNTATDFDIKKAYRLLIAKYHPDVCKDIDSSKKSIEINRAYEILSNDKLKKEYDDIYFN